MATKMTENSNRRSRKAASIQPSPVLDAHSDIDKDKDSDVAPVSKPATSNLDEEIRRRAYELYLERGRTPGNESEDWRVAEQQVRSRQMQQAG